MAEAKKGKVTSQKTAEKKASEKVVKRTVGITEAKKGKVTSQKTAEKKASEKVAIRTVGIKKEYLESKNVCRVTFTLPKIAASDAKNVSIVGDFNNWNIHANPLKKLKNEDYTIKLDLEPGKEYQFRYLIDESRWENDWNADKYVKSHYGNHDNSVVLT